MQNTLLFENAKGEREEQSSTEFKKLGQISFPSVLDGEPLPVLVY
ncbi:hypothetical protein PN498_21335 [Oscillatoria sp. CS-180]|nr:hypothetical protein [Oscillatoria sp. CS-180]MDB9528550.1 hypothetical protein [Oscillatoria sp. CS-180]